MLIERAVIPEIGLTATDAAMTGLDRITNAIVPPDDTTGVPGNRSATANFVETVTFLGIFIVKGFHKKTGDICAL